MLEAKTIESPNTTRAVAPHGYWIIIEHIEVGPVDHSEKDQYCQLRTNDFDYHYLLEEKLHRGTCGTRTQLVQRLISFAEQHNLEMYIAPCDRIG